MHTRYKFSQERKFYCQVWKFSDILDKFTQSEFSHVERRHQNYHLCCLIPSENIQMTSVYNYLDGMIHNIYRKCQYYSYFFIFYISHALFQRDWWNLPWLLPNRVPSD